MNLSVCSLLKIMNCNTNITQSEASKNKTIRLLTTYKTSVYTPVIHPIFYYSKNLFKIKLCSIFLIKNFTRKD